MNRIARLIGLAASLLLFFLAAVLLSQRWLGKQTEQIRAESLRAREVQLERILALSRAGPLPWSTDFVEALGEALDARLKILPAIPKSLLAANKPGASLAETRWQFDHPIQGANGES